MRELHARLELLVEMPRPRPAVEVLPRLVLSQPVLLEGLSVRVGIHLFLPQLPPLRVIVQRLLPPPLVHLPVVGHPLHLLARLLLRALLREGQGQG